MAGTERRTVRYFNARFGAPGGRALPKHRNGTINLDKASYTLPEIGQSPYLSARPIRFRPSANISVFTPIPMRK
jgi:hypothetical protein